MKLRFGSRAWSVTLVWVGAAAACTLAGVGCGESDADTPSSAAGTGGSSGSAGSSSGASGGGTAGSSGSSGNSGSSGTGGTCDGSAGEAGAGPGMLTPPAWDWSGVIGTGQSLAVGQFGVPAKATTQPYNNLKLSTGTLSWDMIMADTADPAFKMVPLIEPIGRASNAYPSAYPTNIAGETPHAAMANQITALYQAESGDDFVGVHGEVGENGQCLSFLIKNAVPQGVNGRAYAASLLETQAITRLAQAAGKTYGVGAITVTHGECDAGNGGYENQLFQLWSDYNTDIAAITGQTQKLLMIVSQQNSVNDAAQSTLAQWKIGVDHPTEVVCSGPKYQYAYHAADHVHLETEGYEQLGEKYGQIYFERVLMGRNWQPLQPTSVERDGAVITIHFHVPVPPLAWEDTFQLPHQNIPEWKDGKGFEVRSTSKRETIQSVTLGCNTVQITIADANATGLHVGYALTGDPTAMSTPFQGTFHWGLLRDSDPFVGRQTNKAQPNFAVAFDLIVP